MNKLYITDLDGTLLNNSAELSDKSLKMIGSVIDAGGYFTVATARTFATVTELFKGIDLNLPLVLMNGVMIYDPVKKCIVSSESINRDRLSEILTVFEKHNKAPLVYTDCGDHLLIRYNNRNNSYQMGYVDSRNEIKGKIFLYSPTLSVSEDEKVIYLVTLDIYEEIEPLYKEISAIDGISCAFYRDNYTDCYFLEIFAEGVSKATGLRSIREMLRPSECIAFGDNLNDIDLIKEADTGICVCDACKELKDVSDYIVGHNYDNAVAEYIYRDFFGEEL